jgi:putative transposase
MSNSRIFRYFKTSPEIIRLAVMMHVRYPLSLRNVEDLLHERGIDITHETVRFWWNRFGTIFASQIRRRRVQAMRHFQHRRWHLDEVFVKINGVKHYLWRAVDHEGEVLESFVTKRRDKKAALNRRSAERNSYENHFDGMGSWKRSSRIAWLRMARRSRLWARSTNGRSAAG